MGAPFSRFTHQGAAPGTDANTYILFATVGPVARARPTFPQNFFATNGVRKFCLDLDHSHGGTLNAYKSSDEGATWRQVYTETVAAPAASGVTQREWLVEGVQDWKLEWVNGGTAQNPWVADMSLSDDRASAGPAGGGFSAGGNLKVEEQLMPVAEDNIRGVYAVAQKKLAGATYAPLAFSSIGAAATANVKAATGNLFAILATNRNAAVRYLQLYNSTASTAGTPVLQVAIPALGASSVILGSDFFTDEGWNFTTGITWGVSTTSGSYVAATAGETDVAGSYI